MVTLATNKYLKSGVIRKANDKLITAKVLIYDYIIRLYITPCIVYIVYTWTIHLYAIYK